MCVLIVLTTFISYVSSFKKNVARYSHKCTSSCKVPVILARFSWKSVQWESSFSMRMDMTKLIVAFRNFANSPKKWKYFSLHSGTGPCFPKEHRFSKFRAFAILSSRKMSFQSVTFVYADGTVFIRKSNWLVRILEVTGVDCGNRTKHVRK